MINQYLQEQNMIHPYLLGEESRQIKILQGITDGFWV